MAITFGTAASATNGSGSEDRAVYVDRIDDTNFVAVSNTGSDDGTAVIGTLSGTSISYGTGVAFTTSAIGSFLNQGSWVCDVAVLDSTHFIVVYSKAGSGLYARVADFSGTTINSYGTEVTIDASAGQYPSISVLSSSLVAIGYCQATNSGNRFNTLSISGTTITVNTGVQIGSTSVTHTWTKVKALTSTSFAVHYNESGTGYTAVCSVSGTTITAGTAVSNVINSRYPEIVVDSSTTYQLSYGNVSSTTTLYSRIVTYSGTTISSINTQYTQATGVTVNRISCVYKSSTDFILSFVSSDTVIFVPGTISGTVLSFSSSSNGDTSTAVIGGSGVQMSSSKFIRGYQKSPNGSTYTGYVLAGDNGSSSTSTQGMLMMF